MLLIGAAFCIALVALLSRSAHAGAAPEERKLSMNFSCVDCQSTGKNGAKPKMHGS